MTIAGTVTTLIIIYIFFRWHGRQKLSLRLLQCVILIALFNNFGYAFKPLSCSDYAAVVFVVYRVARLPRNYCARASMQETLKYAAPILLALLAGLALLPLRSGIDVIPTSVKIDDVYLGESSLQPACFSSTNITTFARVVLFCCVLVCGRDILDKSAVRETLMIIMRCFVVFFALWTIEWIANNNGFRVMLRDIVFDSFGVEKTDKLYYASLRNGSVGFTGLFSEQSYIAVVSLYYVALVIGGVCRLRQILPPLYGLFILLINGSTTGFMLVPFGVVCILIVTKKWLDSALEEKTRKKLLPLLGMLIVITVVALAVVFGREIGSLIAGAANKLAAYISGVSGGDSQETSAAIRNYGYGVGIQALSKAPLFGLGIGTTRTHGMLLSLLVQAGVVGSASYFYLMIKMLKLRGGRYLRGILIAVTVGMMFVSYSSSYIFSPATIALLLPFSEGSEGFGLNRNLGESTT